MSNKFDIDGRRWLAASPYVDQALELSPEQLEAWLSELESAQPHIAADVRKVIAVQGTATFATFLTGIAAPPPRELHYARHGELIGSYRVLRELGKGGMAVVYLAERADGHFQQQVALKILRFSAEGGEAQRHFTQERQILASLSHPGIARLIDGGVTAAGLPYLAMEYVDGVPIDRFCDERRLSVHERLRLFMKVAEAVQCAHRHLIVHRDLKPSNITVTAEGDTKLLDFGIAKLLGNECPAHAAPPTREAIRLMTPEYSSPEQVYGEPITTATDIYQLGSLLYELLSGHKPYELQERKPAVSLQAMFESEPARPSVAATRPLVSDSHPRSAVAISAARSTTPERLRRMLHGDLDAILLTALRREPERRYASVGRLIDDIDRYQHGRPVSAHKDVWLYRARKFLRRHIAGLAVAVTSMCALILVIVWYTMQLTSERDRAASEALRARREAATAAQVSEFLGSVFRGSPTRIAAGQTTARELLDRGAARIETELVGQPEIQGRLLNVIGDVYAQYDVRDKAEALLERALQLNTQQYGADSSEAADSKFALAHIARDQGNFVRAQRLYEEVLRVRQRTLGPRAVATADAMHGLATALLRQGKHAQVVSLGESAIEIYADSIGADDERMLNALNTVAAASTYTGDLARARTYYEQLVPRTERSLGGAHRHLAAALSNLAVAKIQLGDYTGVEEQLRRALAILESLYTQNHSNFVIGLTNLASLFYETGRFDEAVDMLERAIATNQRVNGRGHVLEATARGRLAQLFRARGDTEAGLAQIQSALDIWRQSQGITHFRYAMCLQNYGELQMDADNMPLAVPALRDASKILRRTRSAHNLDLATALVSYGISLARTGMPLEAEVKIREALSIYEIALPQGHALIASARSALAESLLAQGRIPQAEKLLIDSDEQLEGRVHFNRRLSLQRLIRLYEAKGDRQVLERFRSELAAFERRVRAQ